MPRGFFAQAQLQALADRRKTLTAVPDVTMKGSKEATTSPGAGVPNGLQGALAQMESNAAAAMARFNKSFRAVGAAKTEEPEASLAAHSEEAPGSPKAVLRSDSAPPETPAAEPLLPHSTRFAALELAARRYMREPGESSTPWHHELRGTQWQWVSATLDQPAALLAAAAACLTVGLWEWLWPLLLGLLSIQRLSTLFGGLCLLLAVSGWLLRAGAFARLQLAAFADTVPRMPHACEEMSEMLVELKLMRVDLKSMKAKVAWLPGGE